MSYIFFTTDITPIDIHCCPADSSNFLILKGELVGNNKGNVENCVWELNSSGFILPSTGVGKSPLEMKEKCTFVSLGWDFEKIWKIEEGNTYPYFTWLENYPNFLYIP